MIWLALALVVWFVAYEVPYLIAVYRWSRKPASGEGER
jgi:hypothetical protein